MGLWSFTLFFVPAHSIKKPAFYRGADCISKLMETLRSWLKWVYSVKQTFRWLQISVADRQKLLSSMTINCCICGDSITVSERVFHLCHSTGKVFGVAHSSCNLKARSTSYLPMFFHNLSHYDAHHIIKNLTVLSCEKMSATSRTDET